MVLSSIGAPLTAAAAARIERNFALEKCILNEWGQIDDFNESGNVECNEYGMEADAVDADDGLKEKTPSILI